MVKNLLANAGDTGSAPGSGRSSGEGNGNTTPGFLPGESHGQRSLVGYSPWLQSMGLQRVGPNRTTRQQKTISGV